MGRRNTERLLAVLLALALSFVGFGHRMLVPAALDLAAYAMPDGTLPDLCVEGSADQGKVDAPCPACVIAAMMQMPDAVGLPAVDLRVSRADGPVVAQPMPRSHHPRAPPARGPPAAFLIV